MHPKKIRMIHRKGLVAWVLLLVVRRGPQTITHREEVWGDEEGLGWDLVRGPGAPRDGVDRRRAVRAVAFSNGTV
jgi:hypothetical protein